MHTSYPYSYCIIYVYTYCNIFAPFVLFPSFYISHIRTHVCESYIIFTLYEMFYIVVNLRIQNTLHNSICMEYIILHTLCCQFIFILAHLIISLSKTVFTNFCTIIFMIIIYILLTIVSQW